MSAPKSDAGFVMMDALVAVAVLGLVGTGALALATGLLSGQDRQLDRSVALLMAELLARQYALLGPGPAGAGLVDEQFTYDLVRSGEAPGGSRLVPMVVVVREKGPRAPEVLRLDFLASAQRS